MRRFVWQMRLGLPVAIVWGLLVTPAFGEVHAFHAYIRASHFETEAAQVRVPFGGERYDVSGDFRPDIGTFTVPKSGIYHFTVNLNVTVAKDRRFEPGLKVVRVDKPVSHGITQSAGPGTVAWSVDLLLYKGDLVFVTVDKLGDGPLRIEGGDSSWFTGRMVADVDVKE